MVMVPFERKKGVKFFPLIENNKHGAKVRFNLPRPPDKYPNQSTCMYNLSRHHA